MADPEHSRILEQGVENWNKWRGQNPITVFPNLSQANLSEADLSGADLSEADLTGANLRGANLRNADLWGAKYDDKTTWPTGFTPPPEAWKVAE